MTKILIRQADLRDAELIADLSRQTFYETFAYANTKENMELFLQEQFSRKILMNEVRSGNGIFFLANDGNSEMGYVYLREGQRHPEFQQSSSIEIARIYAVQAAIGKGVGAALIKKSIATATELKREIIWLGVWEHNKRAIDFYTKWGFEKFGEHEFLLGKDVQRDWLMKFMI